jgi:hypothetical protein
MFMRHHLLMAHHTACELQGLVALIGLGRLKRARKKFTHHLRRSRLPKVGDEATGQVKTGLSFLMVADIGSLQGEIDSPGRRIGHIGGHQLLAEQKARARGKFNTGTVTEADGCAIDDHHVALA